jgi:hypothetical protein
VPDRLKSFRELIEEQFSELREVKWPISQHVLLIDDEVAYSAIDVKINGIQLHMHVGLATNSLDLMTRKVVRLCASICDTGLNLACNWLSAVEFAEKLQSVVSSVHTSWMEGRQLYKINWNTKNI